MNWIENWLHVSPDHGDGSLEILFILAIVAAAVMVFAAMHHRTRTMVLRWFLRLGDSVALFDRR